LGDLGELAILLVLFLKLSDYLLILNLKLLNDHVTLLEFLLYNFELLRISKCVLGLDDFFEVCTQASALIHVAFNFEFGFMGARVLDVALEKFDLVSLNLQF
jgi:hypothetical protein